MNQKRILTAGESGTEVEVSGEKLPGEDTAAREAPGDSLEGLNEYQAMRHVTTKQREAEELSLTAAQQTAIIFLHAGRTQLETASAAGVSRQTLHRWLTSNAAFQVAYNTYANDVLSTASSQLVAAAKDAVETVVAAIRKGDAKLAWELLGALGVRKQPKSARMNLEDLKFEIEMAARKKTAAREEKVRDVEMREFSNLVNRKRVEKG